MTSHLGEEKIRDLLLVLLNAQFEGAAVGSRPAIMRVRTTGSPEERAVR